MQNPGTSPKVPAIAERYRTLLEINNAIITNLTQPALLHAVSEALHRVISFDRCAIALHQPESDTFRFLAVEGELHSDYFRQGLVAARSETSIGWVFDHQRPLVRRDLEKEGEYANEHRLVAEGIHSLCVLPLVSQGECFGTLSLVSRKRGRYSDEDAAFLQEVANQVALAACNMISYEKITTLSTKVERTAAHYRMLLEINNAIITNLTHKDLLRSVSEILRRVVPLDGAIITVYDPKTDVFRFFATETTLSTDYFHTGLEVPRKDAIAASVFETQRPLRRSDLENEMQFPNDPRLVAVGIRSDCIVPLIVGGKSIGTLGVGSTKKNQYSEVEQELLQEVANQIALAVANMRSFEEISELKARLQNENVYLQEEIRTEHNFDEIIGKSSALLAVLHKIEQVAPADSTVLMYGETGTGKELIARAIHDRSNRRGRPLVKVNCSAISAGLVESELFGHVKGAFTGALERHIGRFELADGGTIFLDEIGELPLATQVKLLRVLQEREFEPVGSNRPLKVDVRVIAATNRNLQESIRAGEFRSDLFYRLNVFPIDVPPLRERRSDIPQLAMFFLTRFSKKLGKDIQGIAQETLDRITAYSWPGNVRELQNLIERAVILSRGSVLDLKPDLIPALTGADFAGAAEKSLPSAPSSGPVSPANSTLEDVERAHIVAVLNQTGGVVEGPRGAAKILGLHPNTLRHRIQKLGLKRSGYHAS
jgi:formate hydrogenlyase transcriptional activator